MDSVIYAFEHNGNAVTTIKYFRWLRKYIPWAYLTPPLEFFGKILVSPKPNKLSLQCGLDNLNDKFPVLTHY